MVRSAIEGCSVEGVAVEVTWTSPSIDEYVCILGRARRPSLRLLPWSDRDGCAELSSDAFGGARERAELLVGDEPRERLEAAVGGEVHALRRDHVEDLVDALDDLVVGLDVQTADVDHADLHLTVIVELLQGADVGHVAQREIQRELLDVDRLPTLQ